MDWTNQSGEAYWDIGIDGMIESVEWKNGREMLTNQDETKLFSLVGEWLVIYTGHTAGATKRCKGQSQEARSQLNLKVTFTG